MAAQKKQLRKDLLQKRKNISTETFRELNKKILKNMSKFISKETFDKVFLYHPINNEANLLDLLNPKNTNNILGLPVIKDKHEMDFYLWNRETKLITNRFGIKEPEALEKKKLTPTKNSLIIVPSVGLDIKGTRLGMGEGYYDRYLEKHKGAKRIGLCFSWAYLDTIPRDKHDQTLDFTLTDKKIYAHQR